MNTTTTVQVAGVKQTINALRQIDPELQKQFKADATRIAQPAIDAGRRAYSEVPLSGMAYAWTSKKTGRKVKAFRVADAQKGVQMKFDTRRNAVGVILIIQKDQAAAVFETAGRANANTLDTSLRQEGMPVQTGRTRVIGPAVYRARRGIEREMKQMINGVSSMIARRM